MREEGFPITCQFEYKGKLYSFSSIDGVPVRIEDALKAIDEGRVPSYGDAPPRMVIA